VSLINNLLAFFQKYKQSKAVDHTSYYRIIDVKTDSTNRKMLIVQLRNKNVVYKFSPKEVLADNTLLEGFSKQDIRNITYLAYSSQKLKTKIVMQEFSDKLNSMVFGIQRSGNKNILKKTAKEISFDKNLISELTPEEALMVGYMLADESFSKEKESQ
jgi:ribosomal protein S12